MRRRFALRALTLLAACGDKGDAPLPDDTGSATTILDTSPDLDVDGDGYTEPEDCDDADASIHPGATETCDGVDQDCDEQIDEEAGSWWYPDTDGDSFGDPGGSLVQSCAEPSDHVADATDCDDTDPEINPGAAEICNNGQDDDCDGTDNGCGYVGTWSIDDVSPVRLDAGSDLMYAGAAVGLSDLDLDGYADIVIGAPVYSGADKDKQESRVAFLYGPVTVGGPIVELADILMGSDDFDGELGSVVEVNAELDGDGVADVLILEPAGYPPDIYREYSGRTYAFLSSSGALSDGDAQLADVLIYGGYDQMGPFDIGVADLSGDGLDEIITSGTLTGTYNDAYELAILSSPITSGTYLAGDSGSYLVTATPGDWAGYELEGVGDLDADGYEEMLVGALGDDTAGSNAGRVYLLDGPVSSIDHSLEAAPIQFFGATSSGGDDADAAGAWATGGEDLNGDGQMDLVFGGILDSTGAQWAGRVCVFFGPFEDGTYSLDDANVVIYGEEEDAKLGDFRARISDRDGDGLADLLLGSPRETVLSKWDGRVYFYRGPLTAGTRSVSSATAIFEGSASRGYLGSAISESGDVDGDGIGDTLVGALGYEQAEWADYASGAVYLLPGRGW